MDKKHAQLFESLEKSKAALLSKLNDADYTMISTRNNDKWSPLEQCYHLYLAEHLSRKYCAKKLSFNPKLKTAGLITKLRLWTIKFIEVLPLKFKAPNTVNEQRFPADLSLEMVKKLWADERLELKIFLETLDSSLVNKEIYKQTIVGRLTIAGMLDFFQFHFDRHKSHIKRDYSIN